MKKLFLLVAVVLTVRANTQPYLITFAGTGASTTVGTVKVENMMKGTTVNLSGDDILNLTGTVGIPSIENEKSMELKIYPNPMTDYSILKICPPVAGDAIITIYEITGKQVFQDQSYLENDNQEFRISGMNRGLYLIIFTGKTYKYSGKLLCTGKSNGKINFKKVSNNIQPNARKEPVKDYYGVKGTVEMEYTAGDRLKFTGTSTIYSTVMTDIPSSDKTITFNFIACSDGDNNNYSVVQMGSQVWMAENLRTTKYKKGSVIPLITDEIEWYNLKTPGYCWYNNDETTYKNTYGALYKWYTAQGDSLCPIGWHVPTDAQWKILEMFLGMTQDDADQNGMNRGTTEGGQLKETGTMHWLSPNTGATNATGFTAVPGGDRWTDGPFMDLGSQGFWWSSTEANPSVAWARFIVYNNSRIGRKKCWETDGCSVRCLKD
jgi:uncharacterized protein (TIGR02145 family)